MNEMSNGRRSFVKLLFATPLAFLKPLFTAPTDMFKPSPDEWAAREAFEAFLNRGDGSVFEKHGFSLGVPANDPFIHSVGLHPSIIGKSAAYRAAFPDLHFTILSSSQQGGVVKLRWRADGTHRAPIGNLHTTGKRVSVPGSSEITFVYGKITKFVSSFDHQDLRGQLGAPRVG